MQVQVSPKHKVVGVPFAENADALKNLFPKAPVHAFDGKDFMLINHSEAETFMLRQLGYEVPAPILTQYSFPAPPGIVPFEVQRKTCALLTMAQRAYVLNGMGTGKTKCALWSFDYLKRHQRARRMLVVCPRSTMTFTWVREAFEVLPETKVVVLHGHSKKVRVEKLKEDADIYVINHDGIKVLEKELMPRLKTGDIDVICIDELAKYRNKSERTKVMMKMAGVTSWVWGMTGSPMPHEPTDVYYQARIVTPGTVPNYYSHFEAMLMNRFSNGTFTKLTPKPDAIDRAFDAMQPAVRFTIDEVTELPPCIERYVDVDLGVKQKKIYKDIVNHCQSMLANGELVTAANAGAAMNKLLQISLGWVYSQINGQMTVSPLDNDLRIEALMDAIDSTTNKVLVFVPFKHALAGISDALTSEKIDHAVVSGDTPDKERNRIFNLFQNTGRYRVLEAHPECLAHGITLTAADTVVWFGPITSNETYDQANHRIKRVGQKNKQQIIHLQSTPVERRLYASLRKQADVQKEFLQMFADTNTEW